MTIPSPSTMAPDRFRHQSGTKQTTKLFGTSPRSEVWPSRPPAVTSEGTVFHDRRQVFRVVDGVRVSLSVEVSHGPNYVTVAHPQTSVFGSGRSEAEALSDFQDALIDFRDTLAKQDRLAPHLRLMLARLNVLL